MDYSEMRAMQIREETGYLPDEVYSPDGEDMQDPDHHEIAAMVMDQYARTNAERAVARIQDQNLALRGLLMERGMSEDEIDVALNGE
jgi:hypothetical protein